MSAHKIGSNGRKVIGRPFQKGQGGRKPGALNKFTTLKASFLETFEALGSTQGLLDWARKSNKNRELFYGWLAKMLPHELALPPGAGEGLTVIISEKYRPGYDGRPGSGIGPGQNKAAIREG